MTLGTAAPAAPVLGAAPPLPGFTRAPTRRSPLMAALCALLVVGCALAAYAVTTRAGQRITVVQVTAPVPVGGQVTAVAALDVAALPHLPYLPWSARGRLAGLHAATALVAGQPLLTTELTDRTAVPPGDLVVGVQVKPGQYPLGLAAGNAVAVIAVPASSGTGADAAGATTMLVPNATVATVSTPDGTDPTAATVSISLYLTPAQAIAVAPAAAQDALMLALTTAGG